MIRIAFSLIGGGRGTGGYNYLLNLVRVLREHQSSTVTPVLTVASDEAAHEVEPFAALEGLEIVRSPALEHGRQRQALAAALLWGHDPARRRMLHEARIDVVFESARFYGWRLGLPVIAWIPDFQHRKLPHMFTRRGYWRRELGFQAELAAGRTIMLSSEDARRDCERFYPQSIGRTKAVRFAVPATEAPSLELARAVADGYGLPHDFVFMPNQFSKHKNHLLVLDALEMLRARGRKIVIACSGKQDDERHPDHFPRVKGRLDALGMHEQFRLLGMIPYPHVTALMRASMALLNPSLFEGWSTPVEEARGLGVPLLLSDLDVHREQASGQALFFERHSASSLAEALEKLVPATDEEKTQRLARARLDVAERVRRFAAEFATLARDVAEGRRPS